MVISSWLLLCPFLVAQGDAPALAARDKAAQDAAREVAAPGSAAFRDEIERALSTLAVDIGAAGPSARKKSLLERKKRLLEHDRDAFDELIAHAEVSGDELDVELLKNEFKVEALRHPYQRGNFSWQVLAGGEISEGNDSFSSPTGYLRFVGDTAFRPTDNARDPDKNRGSYRNWHGVVDLALSTIPVEDDSTPGTTFIESEKALSAAVGLDLYFYQHPPSEDG
ncbi:MAG: hypothetical protein HOP15_11320, partial [Planctomycetes bacterium]|nr:hypothetical protein [Planctomycetota bacterium]